MTVSEGRPSALKVTLVVGFYMISALVMVFVNKAVLNSSPNLPLLMLLIQFLIAVFCLHISAYFTPRIEIPRKLLSRDKFTKLAPILVTNVVGLTFNTLCLRGVDASFFQIARGLVLPLTILVSSLEKRASPNTSVLAAGTVVTLGFFIGIVPKGLSVDATSITTITTNHGAAPLTSLIWGALSSLMTAVHAVLIKRSLPYVDNSAIQLAYWTNASAALVLFPFVLFDGEVSSVWTNLGYGQFLDPAVGVASSDNSSTSVMANWDWQTFVVGSLVTGVVGFLLCVAGLLSIKITSPVTHMFSSACRSVLQTILGVWIFRDILSINRVSSILTILGGSMYYTWIKSRENSETRTEAPTARRRESIEAEVEEGLLMKQQFSEGSDSITLFEVADASDEEEESDTGKERDC